MKALCEKLAEQYAEERSTAYYIGENGERKHYATSRGQYSKQDFLAGYKAAQELYAAKLKEANDTIAGMADECEGLKTIIYDHDKTNLPTSAKWISVKEVIIDGKTYRLVES